MHEKWKHGNMNEKQSTRTKEEKKKDFNKTIKKPPDENTWWLHRNIEIAFIQMHIKRQNSSLKRLNTPKS